MFGSRAFKGISAVLLGTAMMVSSGTVEASSVPEVKLLEGVAIGPAKYGTGAAHSAVGPASVHPELLALARSLKNDPQLIYGYVHNTIETLALFGLKKGPLGALIDKKGTAFDQAALMVALLKAAATNIVADGGADPNFAPSFRFVEFTVPAAEMTEWFGYADQREVCSLLQGGGIPFTLNNSQGSTRDCASLSDGSYTSVDLFHVVVEVDIDGSTKAFDPAYKQQNRIAGINLTTAISGFDADTAVGAASISANTSGVYDYITATGQSALETQLGTYAQSLVQTLQDDAHHSGGADNYLLSTTDVVGGVEIAEADLDAEDAGVALSSLPFYASTLDATAHAAVPNQYRTHVHIAHNETKYQTFMDELYGRRVWFQRVGYDMRLVIGDKIVWTAPHDTAKGVHIWINQPYGGALGGAGDRTESFNPPFSVGSTAALVLSAGDTSLGLAGRYLDDNYQSLHPYDGTDAGDDAEALAQLSIGATFLAQQTQLKMLVDGITGSRTVIHDVVGMVAGDDGDSVDPHVDIRAQVSVTGAGGSQQARTATMRTFTAAMSAVEGAAIDQFSDVLRSEAGSATAVSVMAAALAADEALVDVPVDEYVNLPSADKAGYGSGTLSLLENYNTTHSLIVPTSGSISQGDYSGAAFVSVDDTSGHMGHLLHDGGYASNHPVKGVFAPEFEPTPALESLNTSIIGTVGMDPDVMPSASGAGFTSTDLVTGSGSFPYSLNFTRSYAGGASAAQGWSYSLDIDGGFGTNVMVGLGERAPVDAAEAIVALKTIYDASLACQQASACSRVEDVAFAAMTASWMQKQLRDNIFTIRRGHSSSLYAKLAGGGFNGPSGAASALTTSGSGASMTVSLETKDGAVLTFGAKDAEARDFDPERWTWPFGMDVTFAYSYSDTKRTATISNSLGRTLTIVRNPYAAASSALLTAEDENGNEIRVVNTTYGGGVVVRREKPTRTTIVTYDYDAEGRIVAVDTPEEAGQVTLTYDDMGQLISRTVKDRGTYTAYANSWRSEMEGPDGSASHTIVDPYGRFAASVDALGRRMTQRFDRLGRTVYADTPADEYDDFGYSETTYDKYHAPLTVTAYSKPNGGTRESLTTSYSYYGASKYRQVHTVTNPLGQVTTFDYFESGASSGAGLLASTASPLVKVGLVPDALVTSYDYDENGMVETVTSPDGTRTHIDYLANGLVDKVIADEGGLAVETSYSYTPEGDVATVTDHRGNTTSYTYDDFRRPKTVALPDGGFMRSDYDGNGRVYQVIRRLTDGTEITNYASKRGFDAAGRVTWSEDQAGNLTRITYHDTERYIEVEAPNGVTTQRHFDELGRVWKTVMDADGEQVEEQAAYNRDGSLLWVEDGRETKTYYEYDHWGRQTKSEFFGRTIVEEITAFDDLGRPTEVRNRAGDVTTFVYDALGRVESQSISTGVSYAFKYDYMSRIILVTRSETGEANKTVHYSYDDLGRVTRETGEYGYYMATTYDDTAGSYTLDYNGSYSVFYAADALGRVDEIREGSAGGTLIADYTYDTLSRLKTLAFGNGAVQEFGYNTDSGWLETLTLDGNGDGTLSEADSDVSFTYHRDKLGRIEREDISNSSYIFQPTTVEETVSYLSNPINQYTSIGAASPTYDDNGNLTGDGTYTYEWNAQNQLVRAADATTNAVVGDYAYDALGRRSYKRLNEDNDDVRRYLWGGWTNYAEFTGTGSLLRRYVYGPGIDEPIMVKEADGTKNYVHRDGKNTVIAVSGTGGITNSFTMDVWGDGTDEADSPYKFTSRRLDAETGNYYYRNRYYHSKQGRFMSNDPIGYGDGLNMYAYAGNDPVNRYDPMGLASDSKTMPNKDDEVIPTIEEITTTAPRTDRPAIGVGNMAALVGSVGSGGNGISGDGNGFRPAAPAICPPGTTPTGYEDGVAICQDSFVDHSGSTGGILSSYDIMSGGSLSSGATGMQPGGFGGWLSIGNHLKLLSKYLLDTLADCLEIRAEGSFGLQVKAQGKLLGEALKGAVGGDMGTFRGGWSLQDGWYGKVTQGAEFGIQFGSEGRFGDLFVETYREGGVGRNLKADEKIATQPWTKGGGYNKGYMLFDLEGALVFGGRLAAGVSSKCVTSF